MRVAVGADHRGCALRGRIIRVLEGLGHEVLDFGTRDGKPVDYPDLAATVGQSVSHGETDRGILFSGSGLGMSVVANKFRGVRAVACYDDFMVERSRRHLDANVLCLPGDLLGEDTAVQLVETWMNTPFDGGRHTRRVEKISKSEDMAHNAPSKPRQTA